MADVVSESIENENVPDSPSSGPELEKQLSLEKSTTTTSHHHDSEYDTASDLEGNEEDYDEDDESLDDDKDDDIEEGSSDSGSEYEDDDEERQRGDGQEQIDNIKKVDEDRSNPQYIPKKGTFYEHDDRTTDEPEIIEGPAKEGVEVSGENSTKSSTPTISSASKTMKKWQPASGIDRWSHDRFDEGEQAPKSRAELVSAYGYDIRNEDGPPRARRRRRYGRGPSKYNRNWEDESAYIKTNNVQRKPPRPEDFPALDEKKPIRRNSRKFREEKENRYEFKNFDNRTPGNSSNKRDNIPRDRGSRSNGRNYRSSGNISNAGRRTMEFKNKNRSSNNIDLQNRIEHNNRHPDINAHGSSSSGNRNYDDYNKLQLDSVSFTNTKVPPNSGNPNIVNQRQIQHQVQNQHDRYNNGYNDNLHYNQNQNSSNNLQYMHREMKEQKINLNMLPNQPPPQQQLSPHQHIQNKSNNIQNAQLQTRLQQVQGRNDPSHVGSIQMHSLASPQQQQQQMLSQANSMGQNILPPDLHQQEQSRAKRYSNLRQRTQNDPSVMQQMVSPTISSASTHQQIDQHSLQQMHLQHDPVAAVAAAAAASHHQQQQALLQANLIQLYQDNLQAQQKVGVAAIQNLNPNKPPPPPSVPSAPQFPNIVHNSQFQSQPAAGSPAYYAPNPNEYAVPPAPAPVPGPTPPTPYLPFAAQTQPPPPNVQQPPPPPAAQPNPMPANPASPYQNYPPPAAPPQYPPVNPTQQFNTVGGTTYFVPHTQPTQRQSSLPQRRPTNAIPILPPSDKNKSNNATMNTNMQQSGNGTEKDPNGPFVGSVENIDHILDNMFVQRQHYQPPIQQSSSQTSITSNTSTTASIASTGSSQGTNNSKSENRIEDAIKNLSISETEKSASPLESKPSDTTLIDNKLDKQSSVSSENTSAEVRDAN